MFIENSKVFSRRFFEQLVALIEASKPKTLNEFDQVLKVLISLENTIKVKS